MVTSFVEVVVVEAPFYLGGAAASDIQAQLPMVILAHRVGELNVISNEFSVAFLCTRRRHFFEKFIEPPLLERELILSEPSNLLFALHLSGGGK